MARLEGKNGVGGGRAAGVDVGNVCARGQVILKLKQAPLVVLAHVEGRARLAPQVHAQAAAHLLYAGAGKDLFSIR